MWLVISLSDDDVFPESDMAGDVDDVDDAAAGDTLLGRTLAISNVRYEA